MPIYEYQCTHCGHPLEAFQKISEPPLTECPSCGKQTLKKLISSTSFQLKGTGWYVTDIRDKNKPKPTQDESKPSTETAAKDATSTAKDATTTAKDVKKTETKPVKESKSDSSSTDKK